MKNDEPNTTFLGPGWLENNGVNVFVFQWKVSGPRERLAKSWPGSKEETMRSKCSTWNGLCSGSASAVYCGNSNPQESNFSRKGQWAQSKHGNLPEHWRRRRICSHVPSTGWGNHSFQACKQYAATPHYLSKYHSQTALICPLFCQGQNCNPINYK